jgi:hypothetical protein
MGRRRSETLGHPLLVRAQVPLIAQIDEWILRHGELMTRPEAIRRLATLGLKSGRAAKPYKPRRSRAAALT